MQLKIITYLILFTCLIYPIRGRSLHRNGCWDCEEEIWEEVSCSSIPEHKLTVTTTTTTPMPTRPTLKQPSPSVSSCSTATDTYQKFYCECKAGCKDFCRKVVVSPLVKQIVHVSKITEPVDNGRIQSTHFLQRKLIADADRRNNRNSDNYAPSYTDKNKSKNYSLPIESSFEEQSQVEPKPFHMPCYEKRNIIAKRKFVQPIAPITTPAYGNNQVVEATVNKQPAYCSHPNSNAGYEFTIHLENGSPKIVRSVFDPSGSLRTKVDDSIGQISDPQITYYASLPSMKNFPFESRDSLNQYDIVFDSFLRNIIESASNPAPYIS